MKLIPYKYISKDDSTYLKGWAILIMIFLHLFGARALNIPAYQQIRDICFHDKPISYCLAQFCSICVHLYILLSGYGLFITYRKVEENHGSMKNLKRIVMLMSKVLMVGIIFYPISIFYPNLGWNFNIFNCVKMLLGYIGNYEWWFLRPYIIIVAISPWLLARFEETPKVSFFLSLALYIITKYLIYFHDFHIPLILEQVFILLISFYLGAALAKWGILAGAKSLSDSNARISILSIAVLLAMLIYKIFFPSGILDPFISAIFTICAILLVNVLGKRCHFLFVCLGKEATSMWLIHTFISIYYWSELSYSFRYPILIFGFVVICSYILSITITIPYNLIRKRMESLFA